MSNEARGFFYNAADVSSVVYILYRCFRFIRYSDCGARCREHGMLNYEFEMVEIITYGNFAIMFIAALILTKVKMKFQASSFMNWVVAWSFNLVVDVIISVDVRSYTLGAINNTMSNIFMYFLFSKEKGANSTYFIMAGMLVSIVLERAVNFHDSSDISALGYLGTGLVSFELLHIIAHSRERTVSDHLETQDGNRTVLTLNVDNNMTNALMLYYPIRIASLLARTFVTDSKVVVDAFAIAFEVIFIIIIVAWRMDSIIQCLSRMPKMNYLFCGLPWVIICSLNAIILAGNEPWAAFQLILELFEFPFILISWQVSKVDEKMLVLIPAHILIMIISIVMTMKDRDDEQMLGAVKFEVEQILYVELLHVAADKVSSIFNEGMDEQDANDDAEEAEVCFRMDNRNEDHQPLRAHINQ